MCEKKMMLIASVHSKKNLLKKFVKMIIIFSTMNKSQDTTVLRGRQKPTAAMKLRPEK